MSWPVRCVLALVVLGSACSDDADGRRSDAGSESSGSGKGGGGGSNQGGAGAANSNADSGRAGSSAGRGGAGSAADSGASGCNADCKVGEHCELVEVTCVRAPCPPLPMCVPDGGAHDPAPRDCDPRKIMCKRTAPECPELQVPSVEGSCYGECVDVHACQCAGPEACPLPDKFTCNMSAKHCTPYLR